ncbi:hypothetical protein WG66_012924 [Moniliophthora roreri]|nr:hypothetical protein WG66_012924 [Moniliophthora roreri]
MLLLLQANFVARILLGADNDCSSTLASPQIQSAYSSLDLYSPPQTSFFAVHRFHIGAIMCAVKDVDSDESHDRVSPASGSSTSRFSCTIVTSRTSSRVYHQHPLLHSHSPILASRLGR